MLEKYKYFKTISFASSATHKTSSTHSLVLTQQAHHHDLYAETSQGTGWFFFSVLNSLFTAQTFSQSLCSFYYVVYFFFFFNSSLFRHRCDYFWVQQLYFIPSKHIFASQNLLTFNFQCIRPNGAAKFSAIIFYANLSLTQTLTLTQIQTITPIGTNTSTNTNTVLKFGKLKYVK